MTDELLYPDPARPQTLMQEITTHLAKLPYVERIFVFGSLARQESDRWSDIDMLVVTPDQAQFCLVWEALNQAKPVIHHHPLTIQSSGRHALGNVFVGESVFHCLDLNFMTRADAQVFGSLDRFSTLIEVYAGEAQQLDGENGDCTSQELTPDEERIAYAMHFTKKNLKRMLRGSPDPEELRRYLIILKQTMQDYPADYRTTGGQIGQVAHAYIRLAEELIRKG